MSIFIFIVILVVLILAHEFGHFIVAKMAKIRVDEFGIGFPPKILSFGRGETKYTLNLFPIGGFVKIFGEDGTNEKMTDTEKKRSFAGKGKLVQAAVVAAGVLFNIILAWFLISISFTAGFTANSQSVAPGVPLQDIRLVIDDVVGGSPADMSGLKPRDTVIAVTTSKDSLQVENLTPEKVRDFIAANEGEKIAISYKRDGENMTAFAEPQKGIAGDRPAIGVIMSLWGKIDLPAYQAVWYAGKTTAYFTAETGKAIGNFFKEILYGQAEVSSVIGPVGLVGLVGKVYESGFAYLLIFTALISINLAIINLIPFPALDGGRLLFILIESIKGSPIKPRITQIANASGFVILILLMILVTWHDIANLVAK